MGIRSLTYALLLFAGAISAVADTFVVTTSADSGPGSLRQGILDANSHTCQIPCWINTASAPSPILLQSPLPPVRANAVTIAPLLQDPSFTNQRLIVHGEGAGIGDGLRIEGAESVHVSGLALTGFLRHGIVIDGAHVVFVTSCDFVHNATNGVLLFNSSVVQVNGCLVGDNGANGIYARSCKSLNIGGNLIGGPLEGAPMPNGANGISLDDSQNGSLAFNHIWHNKLTGLLVSTDSHGNFWDYNQFDDNGLLGIDIGADGPSEALMPVIDSATYNRGFVRVMGTVHSSPNSSVNINVYMVNDPDPSGFGEGFRSHMPLLGNGLTQVKTDANGDAGFTAYLADDESWNPIRGYLLTALATSVGTPSVSGESSEFARDVAIVDDPVEFDVTNTADSGPGSLRDTIKQANAASQCNINYPCVLGFHIAGSPGPNGVYTIQPLSQLPALTRDGVGLDGATQRQFSSDTNLAGPEIEINGALCDGCNGLEVRADAGTLQEVLIREVTVNGFPGDGIVYAGFSDQKTVAGLIDGCYIGVDPTGARAVPNGGSGIRVENAGIGIGSAFLGMGFTGRPSSGNTISGNSQDGIKLLSGSIHATGNRIGTDRAGLQPVANGASGIEIGATEYTQIDANVIAFNRDRGVSITQPLPSGGGGEVHGLGIFGNSIHSNGGAGIAVLDVTGEPNTLVTGARFDGKKTHISYSFTGKTIIPALTLVSFYASSFTDASGYGEGKLSLGQIFLSQPTQDELVVDSNLAGKFITYTVTPWDGFYYAANGMTSPFARDVQVTQDGCSNPDPQLVAPAADVEAAGPVTFNWSSVPGAMVYRIWMMKAGDMPRVAFQGPVTQATLTLPSERYEWWVEAAFDGCYGTQSEHRFVRVP
jgi:hypothetical protein